MIAHAHAVSDFFLVAELLAAPFLPAAARLALVLPGVGALPLLTLPDLVLLRTVACSTTAGAAVAVFLLVPVLAFLAAGAFLVVVLVVAFFAVVAFLAGALVVAAFLAAGAFLVAVFFSAAGFFSAGSFLASLTGPDGPDEMSESRSTDAWRVWT